MISNTDSNRIIGLGTALATPFGSEGQVEWSTLTRLIEFQIENGANFLVPLGSTGEASTLDEGEQLSIVNATLKQVAGRVPVLVGCSHNNTHELIERARKFAELGVTHVLSASPYYNKPTQEGIYRHYRSLKEAVEINIMAYTIPGRTGGNITPETIVRLVDDEIIFGLKEASGNILQIQDVCRLGGHRLSVFCGDDALTIPAMAVGAAGVIAVAANAIPRAMRDWVDGMLTGDYTRAREKLAILLPLFDACNAESNPIPIKGALALMGLAESHYRLPLLPPQPETLSLLKQALLPFLD